MSSLDLSLIALKQIFEPSVHHLTAFPKMKVSQRKPYVLLHIVCKVVLVIFSNFRYGMLRVVISGVVEKLLGFLSFLG